LKDLRPLINTAKAMFELVNTNRTYFEPWFSWVKTTQKTEDSFCFLFEEESKTVEFKGIGYMIVLDEQLIGHISLFNMNLKHKYAEIGYWIDASHTRKGHMTEAVKMLSKEAFKNLNIHRLEILCEKENTASATVAKKSGFQFEGIIRGVHFNEYKDCFVDLMMFSRLKTDL
jgi:RimJ/RimL family protein N-acetyltransferase